MSNRVLFLFILVFITTGFQVKTHAKSNVQSISSPDENLQFVCYQKTVTDGKKQMCYTVTYKEKQVILESDLGVLIENNLFESALGIENDPSNLWCENLDFTSSEDSSVNEIWKPVYGEGSLVKDEFKQMVLHFSKFGVREEEAVSTMKDAYDRRRTYEMDLIVRVYNGGVAFRYHFPETKNGLFLHIMGEQTSFTLPNETMGYYERWAQGEYHYLPLKNWPDECERPLTLNLKNGLKVSLLEAQMIDYSRGKFILNPEKKNTINLSIYDKVDVITPYSTPWRVIMVAETAGELIENNDIILNLNAPNQIENLAWIKPGKVIRDMTLTQENALACIDFAAERNLQYVHLDARWYGPEMTVSSDATTIDPQKNLDIQALVNYGAEKGIGVWLYINQRALYGNLDEVFTKCREWGIKGVKFGFVQIGSNKWTIWLHNAVKKAAEYHLMVDIHDEYRPTGFSRTYPNLMTQEGIRGNEEMPDATHNTILPFTRYLVGAADYTICYYNERIKTTHAHQLALAVVCYSPIQFMYWYDKPSFYEGEPEIEFFDAVPTVWDDTKVLSGEIGEYIVTARRSGDEWFIGAITNTEARKVQISFPFLERGKKYSAIVYTDDNNVKSRTNVRVKTIKVDSNSIIDFTLENSGGLAMHIKPQS